MTIQDSRVSFCMSTYKRPDILRDQLSSILKQTFKNFEIVVSDNDPQGSANQIAASFNDHRIRYFHNGDNLGMMTSFNKSIDRAASEFVVMITDDDPVVDYFLSDVLALVDAFPGFSLYGGFHRKGKPDGAVETIEAKHFITEILDVEKTPSILWSSCLMRKKDVLESKKIPEYGSPHLADHALLARTGSIEGGIVTNKMFSSLTQHDNNFSKFNFNYYTFGCKGFHEIMTTSLHGEGVTKKQVEVIKKHLEQWFISSIFNLKKYHSLKNDNDQLTQIDACAKEILALPFMRNITLRYKVKNLIFYLKNRLNFLK